MKERLRDFLIGKRLKDTEISEEKYNALYEAKETDEVW